MKRFLVVALAVAMMMPAMASARGFRGGFGGYRGFRGGYGYGLGGYGYGLGYNPYYGGLGYGGYGYPAYTAPTQGSVKFDTHDKAAFVFVNEAYAGTVGQVKTLHLDPGTYMIQVAMPGRTTFESKVYVSVGNTVHLRPELTPVPNTGS